MNKQLLSLPPLDALRGFVAVARRMSITLAANDLCLTQSAVSRQIQSLEEHLGVPLFVRKHRAIELTAHGEQLFQLASPWLERLFAFSESVQRGDNLRNVTITAPVSVTSLWLIPRVGAFQQANPNINVRVLGGTKVLNPKQESIDLAIRYARKADMPADAVWLFGEKVLPVSNKAIAGRVNRNSAALMDEVLLEFEEIARPWLRWSDWLSEMGMPDAKPKAYLQLNQYDQVIQAAIDGQGVALGRAPLVLPMLKDGRLVGLADNGLGNSDYAYWLIGITSSQRPEVQECQHWIVDEARQCARELQSIEMHAWIDKGG